MLYATNIFPGDNVTTQYELTFVGGYIDRDHIKAYYEDNLSKVQTPIDMGTVTWLGPYTAKLAVPATVGNNAVFVRETPRAPLVDFQGSSRITEANLDLAHKQGLFVAVESLDSSNSEVVNQLKDVIIGVQEVADEALLSAAASAASAAASSSSAGVSASQASLALAAGTAAAGQATAASGFADTALLHRNAAEGFKNTASTQAGLAATSASNAASSVSAIAGHAAAALSSANAASSSAAAAGNSASTATNSAANANTSAGNAAYEVTLATAAKNAAATSASQASTYASNSSTFATISQTQAGIATTKAGEAATSATAAATSALATGSGMYCRLVVANAGARTVRLERCGGFTIRINGAVLVIPEGGVTRVMANSSTPKYIYAFNSAGSIVLSDDATAPSWNDANGQWIYPGSPEYVVVGYARADGLNQPERFCRSYYNSTGINYFQPTSGDGGGTWNAFETQFLNATVLLVPGDTVLFNTEANIMNTPGSGNVGDWKGYVDGIQLSTSRNTFGPAAYSWMYFGGSRVINRALTQPAAQVIFSAGFLAISNTGGAYTVLAGASIGMTIIPARFG